MGIEMRRLLTPLVAATLMALAWSSPATATGGDPFTKSWSRVDVDGSRETLRFSGSGEPKTYAYLDERATICGGGPFEGSGTIVVADNTAFLDGVAGCVGEEAGPGGGTLVYDPDTGTIDDGSGLLYHRGNGAREAFLGVWKATDLDGSAMKLTFSSADQLTRGVSYLDDLASSCDPDAVWMADGTGLIGSTAGQGRFITVELRGGCVGQGELDYAEQYRYDVETDSLHGPLDLEGGELPYTVDWHRG